MLRLIVPVLVALAYVYGDSSAGASHKRAPSGFTGVRGKKSVEETYHEDNTIDSVMPLHDPDKGALNLGYVGNSFYQDRNDLLNDLPKRAPSGFLGMRGKKEDENADIYEKRAPSMGFLGMRGKKESENLIGEESMFDKRAPSGFLGMRGKKEFLPYDDLEKRVSPNSFFGMRGKKQPGRSSFFGMRGKKYPYEFRSKFIGVRGKKDEVPMDIYGNELLENSAGNMGYNTNLDLNELMYLLAQGGYGNDFNFEKRKGPSGFFGMRGK